VISDLSKVSGIADIFGSQGDITGTEVGWIDENGPTFAIRLQHLSYRIMDSSNTIDFLTIANES
jgi:hypothetical protein